MCESPENVTFEHMFTQTIDKAAQWSAETRSVSPKVAYGLCKSLCDSSLIKVWMSFFD